MQCSGSDLRTLLSRHVVNGILVAFMRHTLLLVRRHMPLVVRLRKLAFVTVLGWIRVGGTIGANLPCRVRVTVRPIRVSLSSVFRLAKQQNCELEIPVLWVMLTVLRSLLTLRRLWGVNFLPLKLCGAFCPLTMAKLLLLFMGVDLLIRPDSGLMVWRKVLLVLCMRVLVRPICLDSLPACISSVGWALVLVVVIRCLRLPRLVCRCLKLASVVWRVELVVIVVLIRPGLLLCWARDLCIWLGLACRTRRLTIR